MRDIFHVCLSVNFNFCCGILEIGAFSKYKFSLKKNENIDLTVNSDSYEYEQYFVDSEISFEDSWKKVLKEIAKVSKCAYFHIWFVKTPRISFEKFEELEEIISTIPNVGIMPEQLNTNSSNTIKGYIFTPEQLKNHLQNVKV